MLFAMYILVDFICIVMMLMAAPSRTRIVWLPLSVLLLECFSAFVVGLFSLINLGFSPFMILAAHIVLAIALFANLRTRGHTSIQFCDSMDLLAVVAAFAVVTVCGLQQFGFGLDIHFATTDPAVHLDGIFALAEGGLGRGQYFAYITPAMIISTLGLLDNPVDGYHVLIICELINYLLSGLIFYSAVRRYVNSKATMLFGMLFYMLGYPLNNMVFGFCYLGVSVSLIAALVFCLQEECILQGLVTSITTKNYTGIVLSVALISGILFGLITSYSLFVPPVFLATALFCFNLLLSSGASIKGAFMLLLLLFAIPVVFGFILVYLAFFGSESTVGSAIATEGYIYRELYASFVLFLPIAIYGVVETARSAKNNGPCFIFITFVLFTIALLILGLCNKASSYYYYKCYFPLWFFVFYYLCIGLSCLKSVAFSFSVSYTVVVSLIFAFAFSGADSLLAQKRPMFNPQPLGQAFFPIYHFNFAQMQGERQSQSMVELFRAAYHCSANGAADVAFVGSDSDVYWYQSLGRDKQGEYTYWNMTTESFESNLLQSDYIVVANSETALKTTSGDDPFLVARRAVTNMDVVFENEAGTIYGSSGTQ